MTISVFNASEFTQLSIRYDTGYHPKQLSLGIMTKLEYDAMDWKTAVEMANWILKIDEEYNGRD